MVTSKKDASLAGRKLGDPKATKAQKSVAASDLAQAKKGGGTGTSKTDATLAAQQLSDKKSTSAQKRIAGSDLAQTKKTGGKKK